MQSNSKISKLTHENANLTYTTSKAKHKNRDRKSLSNEEFAFDESSTPIAMLRLTQAFNNY